MHSKIDGYHGHEYDIGLGGHRYPDGNANDYPDRDRNHDRFPDRFPIIGFTEDERFPYNRGTNRYPNNRVPYQIFRDPYMDRNRNRFYESDWNRYPYDDRISIHNRYAERYPPSSYDGKYGNNGHYNPSIDSYTPYRPHAERYNPVYESKFSNDLSYTKPYRPEDSLPLRHDNQYNRRYPIRYLPNHEPVGGYTGRDGSDNTFPDRRFRPSSYDSRYPIHSDRGSVNKLPTQFNPDTRYPLDEIIHSARRPEPDSAKRYNTGSLIPSTNKYSSQHRFPISPDRYGNRYGNANVGSLKPGE